MSPDFFFAQKMPHTPHIRNCNEKTNVNHKLLNRLLFAEQNGFCAHGAEFRRRGYESLLLHEEVYRKLIRIIENVHVSYESTLCENAVAFMLSTIHRIHSVLHIFNDIEI